MNILPKIRFPSGHRAICPVVLASPFLAASLFAGAVSVVQAASPIAEVLCEAKPRMEQRLTSRLGATRQAMGLRDADQMVELWSDAQGDWVLVISYASGQSCIVAMGEAWQTLAAPAKSPDALGGANDAGAENRPEAATETGPAERGDPA